MGNWRRRMGIEPTRSSLEPHTGFEDQERHQTPVTSAFFVTAKMRNANLFGDSATSIMSDRMKTVELGENRLFYKLDAEAACLGIRGGGAASTIGLFANDWGSRSG